MGYVGDYATDLGHTFYAVPLSLKFVQGPSTLSLPNETDILPLVWLDAVRFRPPGAPTCPLPVSPRRVRAYIDAESYLDFANPFQPGSLDWFNLRLQLTTNIRVTKTEFVGETIKPYEMSLLLR